MQSNPILDHRGIRWTSEEIKILKDRWKAGAQIAEMCSKLGRSNHGITQKAKSLGLGARPCTDSWPHDTTETLKALFDQRYPYITIAARLGKTKNAVIGKLFRLGLALDDQELCRRRQTSGQRARQRNALRPPRPRRKSIPVLNAPAPSIPQASILELTPHSCRAVVCQGSPMTRIYCGEPKVYQSYCAGHAAAYYKVGRK